MSLCVLVKDIEAGSEPFSGSKSVRLVWRNQGRCPSVACGSSPCRRARGNKRGR